MIFLLSVLMVDSDEIVEDNPYIWIKYYIISKIVVMFIFGSVLITNNPLIERILLVTLIILTGVLIYVIIKLIKALSEWNPRYWVNFKKIFPFDAIKIALIGLILLSIFLLISILGIPSDLNELANRYQSVKILVWATLILISALCFITWFLIKIMIPNYFNSYQKYFDSSPKEALREIKAALENNRIECDESPNMLCGFIPLPMYINLVNSNISIHVSKKGDGANISILFRLGEEKRVEQLQKLIDMTIQ